MPAARLQDKIPGELLPAARQPRMRIDQPNLRLLRRVQTSLQHQTVEDVHRLFQLPASGGNHRREDLLLPRRSVARPAVDGADQAHNATDRCARSRPIVRPVVVGSRQGHLRMGRERSRCVIHVRRGSGRQVPAQTRPRLDLPCASGRRGRLRVLRQAPARHSFLGAQLLWRVRQRWCYDECRRDSHVLFSGTTPFLSLLLSILYPHPHPLTISISNRY